LERVAIFFAQGLKVFTQGLPFAHLQRHDLHHLRLDIQLLDFSGEGRAEQSTKYFSWPCRPGSAAIEGLFALHVLLEIGCRDLEGIQQVCIVVAIHGQVNRAYFSGQYKLIAAVGM